MKAKSLAFIVSLFAVIAACGTDEPSAASQPDASGSSGSNSSGPGVSSAPELFPTRTPSSGEPITIIPGDLGDGLDPFPGQRQTPLMSIELAALVSLNPEAGRDHIAPDINGTGYTESPATSGEHWFSPLTEAGVSAPARWGIYDFALPDEVLIHNLEHGGIGIHYNCPDGCEDLVERLRNLVPQNPSQFIVSPYPDMDTKIAITAWRTHLHLEKFDEQLIREFIGAFKDNAPESIPGNTF